MVCCQELDGQKIDGEVVLGVPTNEQHRFGLGLEYRRQVVEVFDPPHKATPPIHRRTHARTHARQVLSGRPAEAALWRQV